MAAAFPVLVDVAWLRTRRRQVVLCDVRWYLDGRSGRAAYRSGHLPGAVYVDLDRHLAAPPSPAHGRHPLPAPAIFADGMRRAGVHTDTPVVAYDDAGGATAARLVWLLRASGHRAALLDGGISAWAEPLSRVAAVTTPGSFTLETWPADRIADADAVASAGAGSVLIDARAVERFAGLDEPVDARAGHIPGAVNLPFVGNLAEPGGRFLDRARLRRRYAQAGVGGEAKAIVYCGSGVTACHTLLAMEHAGLPSGTLYAGSWSQWSADVRRPVAT